ncbi:hypothetical protein HCN44_000645 [Aphidius gifuensis]|uniref:Cysteine proteinase n=1 Tax=Aphidius gifuensis TaxID=684658 RepID=A0A834XP95_APHGI|nr:uncharacterized protein LOC122854780 [Aphidius gifuensis]XP_044011674.1 uncharacterized protein LOC122854780 [Aphidius gifuensis]XP_044011675.1 uncharacterized protein LOC122854780 [Aphidius gifuensis]XP_044011676.1 uncharacterized protein LOC122854780 [Aphidius gifuensis]KAF7990840.1 hypothetical protein HCN44_000645 [Aphidius gifuensis]
MAGKFLLKLTPLLLAIIFLSLTIASPIDISSESVPKIVLQNALSSFNQPADKTEIIINAQKLLDSSSTVYLLTLTIEEKCNDDDKSSCTRKTCKINVKQNDEGVIKVLDETKQCQDEINESLNKQSINNSQQTLDQDVMNQNEKPFVAVKAHQTYCPNCPYELNPNLPGLNKFADLTAESMDHSSHSDFKYKVINIVRVTRTVPSGSNVIRYELIMEIGQSNCLRTIQINRNDCELQKNIPVKICKVVIDERPWIKSDRKIFDNNCTLSYERQNELNSIIESTHVPETLITTKNNQDDDDSFDYIKTELYDQLALEGQLSTNKSPIDNDDDSLIKVANVYSKDDIITEEPFEAVYKSDENEFVTIHHKFINKFKEFDDFLKDFDVPIKPKINNENIQYGQEVNEELVRPERIEFQDKTLIEASRSKRSLSKEEYFIKTLSQKVMDSLDEIDPDDNKREIIDILESRKIEGNGALYQVSIRIAPTTNCTEKSKDSKNCTQEPGQPMNICKVQIQVSDKMKLENARVLQSKCTPEKSRSRRDTIPGGIQNISLTDETIQLYVDKGLKQYSKTANNDNELELIEVINATRQIVAGSNYVIGVKLGEKICEKKIETNKTCQVKSNNTRICLISVWSRPWLNSDQVTVKCDDKKNDDNKRTKRSLRGVGYTQKSLEIAKQIELERKFNEFLVKYNKSYSTDEEKQVRIKIFESNMKIAEELQKREQGSAIYGASIFSDITPNEFKRKHLGYRPELRSDNNIPLAHADIPNIELPESFDWREHNAVTEVKNQGSCGSCWAFSVTGNVEGQYAIKYKKLISLSEQELVDCDKLDEGCNGGLQENAYRALEQIGGLELEKDYPYDGEDETCHFKKNMARVKISSAVNITSNETQMAQWLVKNGPMAIAINANAMQFYMGGVSHPYKFLCNKNNLDHGVLIVGYGIHRYPLFKKTMPFWIVKNSWGTSWGEQGYYRVYRGDGTCGLNADVSSAIVK